jgi:hypothetical protein
MAWGRSTPKAAPPPPSTVSKLLPVLGLILIVAVASAIGFVVYTIATGIQAEINKKMDKHDVVFTKDGMKVGVKEMKTEKYADKGQGMLVKVWNLSTWPAYKSRLWNKPTPLSQEPMIPRKAPARSESSKSIKKN